MVRKSKHLNRSTSLQDVAKKANVSTMSVSRALRGAAGVSEAKRIEIERIAKQLHYTPNSNARSLAVSNSTLVGISFPTLFNDVFAEMLAGMRDTFELAGLSTVVNTTDYKRQVELKWVDDLSSWRPAGVVLTGCDHHRDVQRKLRRAGVPTLELWDFTTRPIDINVGIDHFKAGYRLGVHVAALGYRKPAYVGAPAGTDARADKRKSGIEKAFRERDIYRPMMTPTRRISGTSFIGGHANTLELLQRAEKPDVIFYVNDYIAFSGMSACQLLGLDVARDIGIVGFNASEITQVLPVALTTARTPRRELGVVGARNLILRIKGVEPVSSVELPVDIVAGDTTKYQ